MNIKINDLGIKIIIEDLGIKIKI